MSSSTFIFPRTFALSPGSAHYPVHLQILDENVTLFLTSTQADELAQLLWNRNLNDPSQPHDPLPNLP